MQLTKTHRYALLDKLKDAHQYENHVRTRINNVGKPEDDRGIDEIDHYLAKERVRIITEALTENQIDY